MTKVLTIKDLGVMCCAVEELIYSFQQDLEKEKDSFKERYLQELKETQERVNHLINHMNEEEEEEENELIDVEDEEDKYCVFINE